MNSACAGRPTLRDTGWIGSMRLKSRQTTSTSMSDHGRSLLSHAAPEGASRFDGWDEVTFDKATGKTVKATNAAARPVTKRRADTVIISDPDGEGAVC